MTHFVSGSCKGELCRCGADATHKVGEEILSDDPSPIRHNLTAYVCCLHFRQIFGMGCTDMVDAKFTYPDWSLMLSVARGDVEIGDLPNTLLNQMYAWFEDDLPAGTKTGEDQIPEEWMHDVMTTAYNTEGIEGLRKLLYDS